MNPPTRGPRSSWIHRIRFWIYQLGLGLFGLAYLFLRAVRRKPLQGIRERVAVYPAELKRELAAGACPIWIHLVSVGEVIAARPLVEELRRRFPNRPWVITTVTSTGRKMAESLVRSGKDHLLYLPWDFGPVIRRSLGMLRPTMFLSFETELWPVLFHELAVRDVPVVVVNGRLSPAAYGRYLWVRPWMEAVLADVSFFFTQSPQDARRYAAIGAAKDRIAVVGNLKWDLQMPQPVDGLAPARLKTLMGLSDGEQLWAAGSTHPGEERILLGVYRRLKTRFPKLRLLIAPRHPERTVEIEESAAGLGISTVRRSRMNGEKAVVLLDTLGELTAFYGVSDVVFVGGSMVPHGGHNLIEPASLSRPILTGPHLQNFQAISKALTQASAMAVVRTEQELENYVARALANPGWSRELGGRARALIDQHRGAVARTAELMTLKWSGRLT